MNKLEEILKQNGPMLSGDLAREFEKRYGVTNQTARRALSRASAPVCRLKGLRFDKNQIFYYLSSQHMSAAYCNALKDAIQMHSRVAYTYIDALCSQSGAASKAVLASFTSSPVTNVKGHRTYDLVSQSLSQTNIISTFNEKYWMLSPQFFNKVNVNRAIGIEIAKNIIAQDFHKWASEYNLVAYGSAQTLFDNPEFAHFRWSYTAPSYIQPMFSIHNGKPGFVVADILYGRKATMDSIRFFIEKLNVVRSFKKVPAFLPILIVQSIEADALSYLKEKRVMVVILKQFYSEEYVVLLDELVNLFANATSILNKNPDLIYDLFQKLERNNGRYNNMSGDLFELLVGSYYSHLGVSYLKSHVFAYAADGKHYKEIDLLIERDGKVIVAECKASKSMLSQTFVEKWFSENIPIIREWLSNTYPGRNVEFQLWSVGGFEDGALQLLKRQSEKTTKYALNYYNYDEMISLAREHNAQQFFRYNEKALFSSNARKCGKIGKTRNPLKDNFILSLFSNSIYRRPVITCTCQKSGSIINVGVDTSGNGRSTPSIFIYEEKSRA